MKGGKGMEDGMNRERTVENLSIGFLNAEPCSMRSLTRLVVLPSRLRAKKCLFYKEKKKKTRLGA